MKDFMNVLFEQGNIWGILATILAFSVITIAQGYHERGKSLARKVQYVTAGLYILFILYIALL